MITACLALLLFVQAPLGSERALALHRQQRYQEAAAEFQKLLTRSPKDALVRLQFAQTLIKMNRIPEALREVEQALQQSDDPELQFQAGQLLQRLAAQRLALLEQIAPRSPALAELRGQHEERRGNLAQALHHYQTAAQLEPNRPGVHYLMGNVLWRLRQLDQAASELHREIELSPYHGLAHLRLGQILLLEEKHEEAVRHLQLAANAPASSLEAFRELGKAYRKLGRLQDALEAWRKLAAEKPDDGQVHYLLANLYRDLGNHELAQQELSHHRRLLERRRQLAEQR